MRFAERMNNIGVSGIRAFFDKGRGIPDAIDLSIGQGDFDVPDAVKAATIEALQGRCGRYSATQGYPEVVEAVRAHLTERFSLSRDDEVMLTAGATGGIASALFAMAGPGDEVLVPDPFFVLYRNLVHLAGATPVYYDLYPDFRLRVEEITRRITDRTRVLIVNSPANPTGAVLDAAELDRLAAVARERDLLVLSDELYAEFVYDGEHVSLKPALGLDCLLVGGVSKSYGMAGWRLGWAAGDPLLIDRMRTLQQFLYACPSTLAQRGAAAAFGVDVSEHVARYRRKRDYGYERLTAAGYKLVRPAGSFFAYPHVPWGDDLDFCNRALSEKLIIVPGSVFSRRNTHFRLCFGADDETLERGMDVLERLATAG